MKKIIAAALCCVLLFAFSGRGKAETGKADDHSEALERMNIQKVEDYLYTITVEEYDYAFGREESAKLFKSGGCAAIRNGSLRGRNYDWTYDDQAYFVIYTPAKEGRHAVLGVAGSVDPLTAEAVDSGAWNDGYKSLVFATLDGMNDAGVISNILVVPSGEAGLTTGSNPEGEDLFAGTVNRYVLDYAGNVDEAIALLRERNIYMPQNERMDQEFHWMISDRERTVVIEFVNNEMVVLEGEKIATNFYLYDFDHTEKTLPRIPEGIERYNIIKSRYASTATAEGMMKMLQRINYSNTYSVANVPFWYSEYCKGDLDGSGFGEPDLSDGDLTKAGVFADTIEEGLTNWSFGRNHNTWITVYSAVYDMENLTLHIAAQERDAVHVFAMSDFSPQH